MSQRHSRVCGPQASRLPPPARLPWTFPHPNTSALFRLHQDPIVCKVTVTITAEAEWTEDRFIHLCHSRSKDHRGPGTLGASTVLW